MNLIDLQCFPSLYPSLSSLVLFSGRQQTGQGLYVFPVLRIREVTVGGDPASLAVVPALQPHDVRPGQEHVDVRAAEMDH